MLSTWSVFRIVISLKVSNSENVIVLFYTVWVCFLGRKKNFKLKHDAVKISKSAPGVCLHTKNFLFSTVYVNK